MSKYTTEVRYICETYAGLGHSVGYDKVDEVIHLSHDKVMGDYPIFDESYREVLNSKILRHYYTREIGAETVGLWKLWLNTRMREIMPYYNKMYESELFHFNPMYDVDLSTSRTRNEDTSGRTTSESGEVRSGSSESENEQNSSRAADSVSENENSSSASSSNETHSGVNTSSENSTTKGHTDKYSDTPQGGLDGMDITGNLYLTNARLIDESETDRANADQQTDAVGKGTSSESGSGKESSSTSENANTSGKSKESSEVSVSGNRNDENNVSTTEDYLEHVQGKRGGQSFSSLLKEYRETFINIDKMIIDELNDLFFGLWD